MTRAATHILEAVLWEDGKAELAFLDRNGNVTSQVIGGRGKTQMATRESASVTLVIPWPSRKPSSDYGTGAAYPPAFGGGSARIPW